MMHFRIRNGTISANNGKLAIQAPIPIDLDCCPHAGQLIQAIAACEDVISFHLDGGSLVIRSGKFKSNVHCCDPDRFPESHPSGPLFPVQQPILPVLRNLLPFVADDEMRPWACGVMFANNSAMATNSICIVENWMPVTFPAIVHIPRDAIVEIIKAEAEPLSLQIAPHAVTFHFPGGKWVTCTATEYKWPDVQRVFTDAAAFTGPFTSAEDVTTILDAVAKLQKFTDDLKAVYFHNGLVSTAPEGVKGTSIDCHVSPGAGVFRADQLAALRGIVDKVGFAAYPHPVPFYGGSHLRGVIVGYQPQ